LFLVESQRIGNQKLTKLAAALAFPCSLFLKSQLPELLPVDDSIDGAVINLSCKCVSGLLNNTSLAELRHYLPGCLLEEKITHQRRFCQYIYETAEKTPE
jgi:hypothetical protein